MFVLQPEILLSDRVPPPLHGVAPRIVLGQAWWDKERKAAYKASDYRCVACGVHKSKAMYHQWLEGHECYEINYQKGLMRYVKVSTLCHFCHNYVHSGRLQALLDRGQIHHAKFAAIIQHGDRVLKQSGLVRPEPYNGPFAEWGKWRLQIGRKKYPPLYKTEEDWLNHFSSIGVVSEE